MKNPVQKMKWLLVLGLSFGLISASLGTPVCSEVIPKSSQNHTQHMNFRDPNIHPEILDIHAPILLNGQVVAQSFHEALQKPEVQNAIAINQNTPYKIILEAEIPASEGGGRLRLTSLNTGSGNRAYNHVELIALLHTNPLLANFLGLYRVEGSDTIAWVPDVTQMNHRLKVLAQVRGFSEPVFAYEAANGVVATEPYLKMLSNGRFPFSNNNDVNLFIHDAMHAVSFAALNGTAPTRRIMQAAKSRNQVALKIADRLKNEISGGVGAQLEQRMINNEIPNISPDSLERTMLLTILMTGNYDYFSAYNAHSQNPAAYGSKQNRELTKKRIAELLKLYNHGNISFKKVLEKMSQDQPANVVDQMKKIFNEEVAHLVVASDQDIQEGSIELLDFFAKDIFAPNVPEQGAIVPSGHVSAASQGE